MDISPIPAKDAEILANYEARISWDIRNIGWRGNGQSLWCEVKLLEILWFGGFFHMGALGWGMKKHLLQLSGIINQRKLGFLWSPPTRKRRTRKWMMGCRASGLIGLMVSWLGRNHDFHSDRVGAGKDDQKTKRFRWLIHAEIDKTIYGRLLPRPMFGHLWSGGISELTLFPLFPLGACRVGKDLSDFDELVNCWWLWQYHCRYLNLTYKRVASMKEPVRFVDFF